ncbi:hypothetical protein GCM10010401_01870 [Rarobacter faecitabidus]|uniref:Ribosome maturation factor RimP n=1 Tax=Rarobacter faecitabidus TaxID=13243 RepID=A0A542ZWG1_RARFA|nr:ribosome maturation factor RimP [Rarobacter faecitabidus]TQL64678.1 ribosome maturation factor RimP [Rarobacter faecitabidus]
MARGAHNGRNRHAGSRPSKPQQSHQPAANHDEVLALLAPVAAADGAYLEDLSVRRAGGTTLVRVTVDLPDDQVGSMSLDQIAVVSRSISDELDRADVIAGAYTLEVSTPGVSRPLTELRHFKRARTRLVTIVLKDGSTRAGRLTDADESRLVLAGGIEIPREQIVRGQVEVEMSSAAKADFGDEEGEV